MIFLEILRRYRYVYIALFVMLGGSLVYGQGETLTLKFEVEGAGLSLNDTYLWFPETHGGPGQEVWTAKFVGNGKAGQAVQQGQSYSFADISDGIVVNDQAVSYTPFFSIGGQLPNHQPAGWQPPFVKAAEGQPGYDVRWQTAEFTWRDSNYGASPFSVANLTNVTLAAMAIKLDTSNGSTPRQALNYNSSFNTISTALQGVMSDPTDAYLTDNSNAFLRIVSPQQTADSYNSTNINSYISTLPSSGGPTLTDRFTPSLGNYDVTLSYDSNYSDSTYSGPAAILTGTVTGNAGTIVIPNDPSGSYGSLADKIFSAPTGDISTYFTTGSIAMGNSDVNTQGAMRDFYTGMAYGFVGSTKTVQQMMDKYTTTGGTLNTDQQNLLNTNASTEIGDLNSQQWFKLIPLVFDDLQDSPYYSEYSEILYDLAGPQVYSHPYSDRWTAAADVTISLNPTGPQSVDTLTFTILGDAVPEPTTLVLLGAGTVVLLGRRRR